MRHNFKDNCKQGADDAEAVVKYLSNNWEVYPASHKDEYRGIDYWIQHKRCDKYFLSIEVKSDRKASSTGNAFIETIQDVEDDRLGWAYYCEADFIFYYLPLRGSVIIVSPDKLRKHLVEDWTGYKTVNVDTSYYGTEFTTQGKLIPLHELRRIKYKEVNIDRPIR